MVQHGAGEFRAAFFDEDAVAQALRGANVGERLRPLDAQCAGRVVGRLGTPERWRGGRELDVHRGPPWVGAVTVAVRDDALMKTYFFGGISTRSMTCTTPLLAATSACVTTASSTVMKLPDLASATLAPCTVFALPFFTSAPLTLPGNT
jgi:hypothetical protein